jgi:hypothetical protein
MLDLKKLEQKLDEALEKETSESLRNWLLSNKRKNFENYLGDGLIEEMNHVSSKIGISFSKNSVSNKEKDSTPPNYDFYKSAA